MIIKIKVWVRVCGLKNMVGSSGGARNFIEPGQKKYRKMLLPSCE